MASLSNIKLKDLYFIEDNRHRRAFLQALREVEEEGYEIQEVETAVTKIKNVQASSVTKQKMAANANKVEGNRGSTPAELSAVQRLKSQAARKYSQTNAVDLKDYKHWRRDEIEKQKAEEERKSKPADTLGFGSSASSRTIRSSTAKAPRPRPTLYDELFGGDDDSVVEPYPKTKTYTAIESILGDDSGTAIETDTPKPAPKVATVQPRPRRHRAQESLANTRKMLEEYIAKKDENPEPAVATPAEPSKVVVEVVAPEETEEIVAPVAPAKPKPKRKPRGKSKKRKVLDADIKRYHSINID